MPFSLPMLLQKLPRSMKSKLFSPSYSRPLTVHVPARTYVWLLGGLNARIGLDFCLSAVARFEPESSNDNGINDACLRASTSLALVNAFHNAGPIWRSPDGLTSHRLDYIAVPVPFHRRVARCKVNKCYGQRWQTAAVRDRWPLEVHVRLPHQWPAKRQSSNAIFWNEHALDRASRNPQLPAAFFSGMQVQPDALLQKAGFGVNRSI